MKKISPGILILLLYALHQDFWFWADTRFFLGLPIGLTYHVLYCVAAAGLFAWLVRSVLPETAETENIAQSGL